jgi:hypothetical protein
MPGLAQAVLCIMLDLLDMWLDGVGVHFRVEAEIGVAPIGLRVTLLPGRDFVGVDHHLAAVNPRREFRQHFLVVVLADAAVEPVVPVVQPADQVVAVDAAVGEQRAAVQATSVEHRHVVAVADHNEVDAADQGISRDAVLQC